MKASTAARLGLMRLKRAASASSNFMPPCIALQFDLTAQKPSLGLTDCSKPGENGDHVSPLCQLCNSVSNAKPICKLVNGLICAPAAYDNATCAD